MRILNEAKVELTILSEHLSLEQISEKVGTHCDTGHRIGEPKGKSKLKWDQNVWRLSERAQAERTEQSSGKLLGTCFEQFIRRLNPYADNYTLAQLPAGVYELSVELPGFKKYVRQGITVQVSTILRIDVALQV